jgi:hypothetical protein
MAMSGSESKIESTGAIYRRIMFDRLTYIAFAVTDALIESWVYNELPFFSLKIKA